MTPAHILARFPHASRSCLAANSNLRSQPIPKDASAKITAPSPGEAVAPGGSFSARKLDGPKLNDENHNSTSSPIPECPICDESLGASERKARDARRIHVRIVSHRTRLIDPDNLCAKWFLDSLRYCGFIRDDSAKEIEYSITQARCGAGEEKTVIDIEAVQ